MKTRFLLLTLWWLGVGTITAAAQSAPPARAHASMAFDPARGKIVLVGGGTRSADDRWITLGDLWAWDGVRWERSEVTGVTRSGHKLAYDGASNAILVVGGNDNANFHQPVLSLDGSRWRQVAGDLSPRTEAAVAYDPVRKRTVVFGGILGRTALGTTHEFDGTRWHSTPATGPAARHSAVMAFHPPTGKIVLFGGAGDNGSLFSDTWTWDGARWTLVDSTGPGPLIGAAAATDEQQGEILLFGGANATGLSGSTWSWDGTRWSEHVGPGPSPRVVPSMAYDPARKVIVLFGGRMEGLRDSDETWEWNGRSWSRKSGAASGSTTDTLRIDVGSPAVNGSVYLPHRARVRVHLGSLDTPPTNEWTNELTIGDSAGRKVMRWVTLGQFDSNRVAGFDLRQTFDLVTLAPLGYNLKTRNGVQVSLAIDGNHMRGTRKLPGNAETQQVDQEIPRMGFIASASDLVPLAVGFKTGLVFIAPVWGPNMTTAESRIFSVIDKVPTMVEGTEWQAWKVEERRESDRQLLAVWYLVEGSPYMVAGDVFLPNGQVQKLTEIALP
jgi:hypothetical protein